MDAKFQHVFDNGNVWVVILLSAGCVFEVLAFALYEDAEKAYDELVEVSDDPEDDIHIECVDLR